MPARTSLQPAAGRQLSPCTRDRSWATALVAPGRAMLVARGRAALWRPLRGVEWRRGGGTFTGPYPNAIAGISGWWDAGTFDGLLDAGARSAAGVEQCSRQRRRQVWQRQPARGIPRHRQHAAAGDAAPERSARRCGPQLSGPAGDAVRRPLSAADGSRSGFPPRNGQPWRRERLDLVSRLVATELASGSVRQISLLSLGGTAVLQADGCAARATA